jgi:hypothetical protein
MAARSLLSSTRHAAVSHSNFDVAAESRYRSSGTVQWKPSVTRGFTIRLVLSKRSVSEPSAAIASSRLLHQLHLLVQNVEAETENEEGRDVLGAGAVTAGGCL